MAVRRVVRKRQAAKRVETANGVLSVRWADINECPVGARCRVRTGGPVHSCRGRSGASGSATRSLGHADNRHVS
eukprot:6089083-Pyramimonas_sp.AAC.1